MNIKYLPIITILFLLFAFKSNAQLDADDSVSFETTIVKENVIQNTMYQRKGKMYVFWGYNRSAYTHSDIRFKGDGYNFKINDIRATDDPTPFSAIYYKPDGFTCPEYNYRVMYYLSDKVYISIGSDHMKYTMSKQATHLSGTIKSGLNTGTYNNAEVVVGEKSDVNNPGPSIIDQLPGGFVTNFEHCDGLNDVAFELGRLEQIWISKNRKHALSVVGSACLGMVVPDSDVDVLGQAPKHDMDANKKAYHLAGYSLSATMGLQMDLYKHLFVLARLKAGYMNLPDILTTVNGGKASQEFNFIEPMVVLGYSFILSRK